MANTAGKAHGLTLLCPIRNDSDGRSLGNLTRDLLEDLPLNEQSPLAKVPNTYLGRFYVLDDVPYQGHPAKLEHLKSRYLVFCVNFYGDPDTWLKGMWSAIEQDVRMVFENCVAFEKVQNAEDFAAYAKKCQITNNLFFNGSTDDPLDEQLKALYLKQELSRFAYNNYGKSPAELQKNFQDFIEAVQPENLADPAWCAGMTEERRAHNYENRIKQG